MAADRLPGLRGEPTGLSCRERAQGGNTDRLHSRRLFAAPGRRSRLVEVRLVGPASPGSDSARGSVASVQVGSGLRRARRGARTAAVYSAVRELGVAPPGRGRRAGRLTHAQQLPRGTRRCAGPASPGGGRQKGWVPIPRALRSPWRFTSSLFLT